MGVLQVGYIKGMARVCTILSVLDLLARAGIDLQVVDHRLWHSLRSCYCLIKKDAVARRDVALLNAELSARGSIRRNWDVVTWTGCLLRLQQEPLM